MKSGLELWANFGEVYPEKNPTQKQEREIPVNLLYHV